MSFDDYFVKPIDESKYAEIMSKTVEPFLHSLLSKNEFFVSFDGKKIHYNAYILQEATASVVICHGFSESSEKFNEMAYYFLQKGYNVFVIDHRGHGLSCGKTNNIYVTHIDSFNVYVKDFCTFVRKVVKPASGNLPLYLFSHSMGGAVAILYLQKHSGVFDKAVLSAPMVIPDTGMPLKLTKLMSAIFCLMNMDSEKVFFKPDFDENRVYTSSHDTSKVRFDYYQNKRKNNALIQNCAPSYRWVYEAMNIIPSMLDKKRCKKIDADILLLQAENDTSVIPEAQIEFISRLSHSEIYKIAGSKHEIYQSTNDVLEVYLKRIFDFFDE